MRGSTGANRSRGSEIRTRGCWSLACTGGHGGNRTGRIFTGDRSATAVRYPPPLRLRQSATSIHRDDGLHLMPHTSLLPHAAHTDKADHGGAAPCQPFLERELQLLRHVRSCGSGASLRRYLSARRSLVNPCAAAATVRHRRSTPREVTLIGSYTQPAQYADGDADAHDVR